ncbi:MAG: D-alanine--D-alanine ligase [Bacteroidota bacterium]
MKVWWHKLTHWEYWSTTVVYLPTFLFWVVHAIKFRRLDFYKFANQNMLNGGLFDDSKYDMYKNLPPEIYPKTIRIDPSKKYDFQRLLDDATLAFPLIVKPDTGYRGIGVQKVFSMAELTAYSRAARENILIQEIIDFPNELGLFYYRLPNEKEGTITNLTIKKFLCVEGDGVSTIEGLLLKTPRFAMQIPKLKKTMNISEVLPNGEKRYLVPFGNHNRGTEFVDGSHLISLRLIETFNDILHKIPGFYYGRLDIRYNSFEELEKGENFSIIEVNGAKSEPTHIYDTKYSFWQAQREILRYQRIFMKIVALNMDRYSSLERKGKMERVYFSNSPAKWSQNG